MKTFVIITQSFDLTVATPLYAVAESHPLVSGDAYFLMLTSGKPMAYVVDLGGEYLELFSAGLFESRVEFYGEL